MSDVRSRILNNIRADIRSYLRNSKPLPLRDSKWDSEVERIMKEEKREYEEEQQADIEMMYQTYYLKHVSGCTFEEWMVKCNKLYKIEDDFLVTSIALGPDNQKQWQCNSRKDAHKRVLKLIGYKRRDHFERGHDFAYDPEDTEN